GESHPYGNPGSGTPDSVASLTLEDARAFWARAAVPGQAAVIFAGDISREEAVAKAEKFFGSWKGEGTPHETPRAPTLRPRTQVVMVPKPGLQQTLILVGRPAI